MQHRSIKLVLASAAIFGAMSMLGYVGVQRGWVYLLEVDAFVERTGLHDQRVRIAGLVAEDKLDSRPAHLVARFDLLGDTARLPVEYRGVVPPMFHAGVEAVVEGQLDDAGVFQADLLMTKCASKYESDEHAQPAHDWSDLPTEPLP